MTSYGGIPHINFLTWGITLDLRKNSHLKFIWKNCRVDFKKSYIDLDYAVMSSSMSFDLVYLVMSILDLTWAKGLKDFKSLSQF